MKTKVQMLKEFHTAFNLPQRNKPEIIPIDEFACRTKLIFEELDELSEAYSNMDMVEVADAITDIMYVLYGTALQFGIADKLDALFAEVHRSNMSKLDKDGKPVMREDGKVMKSELYTRPELKPILVKPDADVRNDNHDDKCFHECPDCNTRCNCNSHPCNHCADSVPEDEKNPLTEDELKLLIAMDEYLKSKSDPSKEEQAMYPEIGESLRKLWFSCEDKRLTIKLHQDSINETSGSYSQLYRQLLALMANEIVDIQNELNTVIEQHNKERR